MYKKLDMNIGAKRGAALVRLIEEYCDNRAWSIRDFARKADVRHSTISAWKTKDIVPDTRSLSKVAAVMGMDLSDLWAKLKSEEPSHASLDQILETLTALEADELAKIGNQVNVLLLSKISAGKEAIPA